MELTTQKDGNALTVLLSGELNTLTAPKLDALLEKELDGVENLSLDFSSCDYVSSAGLRVLLGTYKQLMATGGEMHLTNVGESFMDVLENTGLNTVFDIQ